MTRIFLTFLLCLAFAPSALAASPEFAVGDAVPGRLHGDRSKTRTASNGTEFFAVWIDHRADQPVAPVAIEEIA